MKKILTLFILFSTFFKSNISLATEKSGTMMTDKGELIEIYGTAQLRDDGFVYYQQADSETKKIRTTKIKWINTKDQLWYGLPINNRKGGRELMSIKAVNKEHILAGGSGGLYVFDYDANMKEKKMLLNLMRPNGDKNREKMELLLTYFKDCPDLKKHMQDKFKEKDTLFVQDLDYFQCPGSMSKEDFIKFFDKFFAELDKS